jgi:hypothetical protein
MLSSAISLEALFYKLQMISDNSTALRRFLDLASVEWHAGECVPEKRFVSAPSVSLVAIGGIPISFTDDNRPSLSLFPSEPLTKDILHRVTTEMMAHSGMMSYLNSGNHSEESMFDVLASRGELSVAHTVSLSFLIAGVSTGVENEFNSQRDLIHLSRITVARAAIQRDPPIVVHNRTLLPIFQEVYEKSEFARRQMQGQGRDFEEAANLVFPAAKATAFIMTGTLRNFSKLLGSIADDGKEREYRDVLIRLRASLSSTWPEIFKDAS